MTGIVISRASTSADFLEVRALFKEYESNRIHPRSILTPASRVSWRISFSHAANPCATDTRHSIG